MMVVQRLTVGRPHRLRAAVEGDLRRTAGAGEVTHHHLRRRTLAAVVRDPLSVTRERRMYFRETLRRKRSLRAVAGQVNEIESILGLRAVDEVVAVGRKRRLADRPFGGLEEFFSRLASVHALPPHRRTSAATRAEQERRAIEGPYRISIRSVACYPTERAGGDVIQPDVYTLGGRDADGDPTTVGRPRRRVEVGRRGTECLRCATQIS